MRTTVVVLLSALTAFACKKEGGGTASEGAGAKKRIRIGVINSVTGPEAPIGESLANGIALAEEDFKKAGLPIELVREDDTGKPQIAMSAMEKLATRDEVIGVVGPYTSASS